MHRPSSTNCAAVIRRDFRNARNSSRNSGGRRKLTVTDGALPLHLRPAPGRAPPRFDASLFMLCDFLKQGNGIAGRLNRACKSFRGRFTVHIDHAWPLRLCHPQDVVKSGYLIVIRLAVPSNGWFFAVYVGFESLLHQRPKSVDMRNRLMQHSHDLQHAQYISNDGKIVSVIYLRFG